MRVKRMLAWLSLVPLAACGGHLPTRVDAPPREPVQVQPAGPLQPVAEREHHARFVGLWAVEQNSHALYEVTYYAFESHGALRAEKSEPSGCVGHLSEHCVTGSVANCTEPGCASTVSCVFGAEWRSEGASTLVISGACSDGVAREIKLRLNENPASNTEWGGAGGELLSVGGETGWAHDNWPWAFRKCPAGTNPDSCYPVQ